MKYLNSFNSVGVLNNFYKGKDYKEPNVNVIKTSENEDPIVDMSSEYDIICFFDTTDNLSSSPDLITNYDLTSLESIIIDGNRYEVKDLPLNKSDLEPGEHIIKLKYKTKTIFGNLNNSPVFNNAYLKKVIIPKGIETLCANVFLFCQGLEYIKIPNTVKSISNNIGIISSSKIKFLDLSEMNPNLLYTLIYTSSGYYIDELICPNIETVQNQMFAGKYIKKINLGESVTSIGDLAFASNSYLEELIMPNTVTSIGNGIFNSSYNLKKINISDSLTSIPSGMFNGCNKLEEVNISNNSSLTSFNNGAFSGCTNLIKINVPNTITSIGQSAFNNCSNLREINISNNSLLTSIGQSAFNNCNNLTSIIIPESVTSIGVNAFYYTKLTNVNITNNLTSIGGYAFALDSNTRTNVYFDNSTITNLGNIMNPSTIKTLEIGPNTINQNGELYLTTFGVFYNMESIIFPEGLTVLPNLSGSSSLKTFNIPSTVTAIADNCFKNCNSLEDSYVEDGIRYINIDNFGTYTIGVSDYTLQHYTIKNGYTTMPFTFNSSFTNIQSVTLPQTLTTISNGEFDYLYDNDILTSQQVEFILNINPNAITNYKVKSLMKQPTSYFEDKYFTICALENGTLYYDFTNSSDSQESENYKVLEYSKDDGETWLSINNIQTSTKNISISKNDIILLRSNITPIYNTSSNKATQGIGNIYASFRYHVCGNIMSLLYGDDFNNQTSLIEKNYAFHSLFSLSNHNSSSYRKLIRADKLILPAITLSERCYYDMFYGCTSLTTAPELPATTLASYCYNEMFQGCTALTTAPELPATTLAPRCYERMFILCTSLTTAPELPATTLADYCYHVMFSGCRALTIAPELPATTLANDCYNYMFYGCRALTIAPELPATTLAKSCYYQMFFECTALTTAPDLLATTLAEDCYHCMFQGCTSLTTAPELPATILAKNCYNGMFYGCTALTTAPELPVTTLVDSCYDSMFENCTALTTAPELPATTLASYCYNEMFQGCTALTTAPELPATTLANYCYQHMFSDCSSLTTAPELPATTLADSCYQYMFADCTSLTTAPELPATTLTNSCYLYMFLRCKSLTTAPELHATTLAQCCYYWMFCGCTSLSKIIMLATNISASLCLDYWTFGVAATGTFIKAASMTSLSTGNNGIPEGWTVQDYEEPHIPRELPVGYTEVKYIASTKTGGQYIDLNILLYDVLNKNYDIAMKFNLIGEGTGENTDQGTIFGCQDNTDPWPGTFIRINSNNVRGRYIGGNKKDNDIAQLGNIIELTEKTPPSKNVYNYNNSEKTHTWGTSLFCAFKDSNNTPFRQCEAKIYYFKLFVEGTLVRDLVPCINSSNVPGLYDVVNDVFYTSLSSNPFIYESYQS